MNKPKNVLVLVAGTNRELKAEVHSPTTAKDLLKKIGVKGHLKKYGEALPFADNEDIYPRIENGEKLVATPDMPVAE